MRTLLLALILFTATVSKSQQWSNYSFTHGGITRDYRVYVPAIYNPANPVPLVVALHGLGDNMTNFSGIGLSDVADTANFISVYPQAINDANFGTAWNSGAGAFGIYPNATINDVDFVRCLIDTISAHYNINSHRVYATGFSMGAFLTNRLACELSNKIAAFASVSGTIGSGITCTPSRAISICHFHGTADATISYTNNMFGMNAAPLVNFWVTNNNCNPTPVHTNLPDLVPGDGYTIEHDVYSGGNNGTVVEHFKVNNGPHTWLFTPNNDIDYSTEIWKFFMQKTLPATVIGIKENEMQDGISLYPNPASSFVTITKTHADIKSIALYDIAGNCVMHQPLNDSAVINTSAFSKGIYILKYYSSKGLAASKKVIIQ